MRGTERYRSSTTCLSETTRSGKVTVFQSEPNSKDPVATLDLCRWIVQRVSQSVTACAHAFTSP